jgi:hypothetical protein
MRRQEVEMGATLVSALQKVKTAVSLVASFGVVFASVPAAQADHAQRAKVGIARSDGRDVGFSLDIDVDCAPLTSPGKVQCVVRLRPVGGSLHWSDALVISAPPFAPPLRDRIVSTDAKRNDDAGADLALTLAATGDGEGELYVMGRATVCGERACRPVQAQASARIVVGGSSGAR